MSVNDEESKRRLCIKYLIYIYGDYQEFQMVKDFEVSLCLFDYLYLPTMIFIVWNVFLFMTWVKDIIQKLVTKAVLSILYRQQCPELSDGLKEAIKIAPTKPTERLSEAGVTKLFLVSYECFWFFFFFSFHGNEIPNLPLQCRCLSKVHHKVNLL